MIATLTTYYKIDKKDAHMVMWLAHMVVIFLVMKKKKYLLFLDGLGE
jgi:hypothetical protein